MKIPSGSIPFKSYHVFGSGYGAVYFQKLNSPGSFTQFYSAAEPHMQDIGHNGFIGLYVVPSELGKQYGWRSVLICWPPTSDNYMPEKDLYPARWWLNVERILLKDNKISCCIDVTESRHSDGSNWQLGDIVLQGNYISDTPINYDNLDMKDIDYQIERLIKNVGDHIRNTIYDIITYKKIMSKVK